MKKILSVVFCILVLCGIFFVAKQGNVGDRAQIADDFAMAQLAKIAQAMIADGGPNIRRDEQRPYIVSFSSFYDYVAKMRPSYVASRDDPNPFAGLLPEKSYRCLVGNATSSTDILISSESFHRPPGDIIHFIVCGGWETAEIKQPVPPPMEERIRDFLPIILIMSTVVVIHYVRRKLRDEIKRDCPKL